MLLHSYNVHEVRIQALYYIHFLSSGIDCTLQYSTTYILWWKVKSFATVQNFGVCKIFLNKLIPLFYKDTLIWWSDCKDMLQNTSISNAVLFSFVHESWPNCITQVAQLFATLRIRNYSWALNIYNINNYFTL